jgi:hypothetical protein
LFENFITEIVVDNTNYFLIGITAVLALITYYYSRQTKKTVIAIEESTKAQFRPFLKSSIFFHKGFVPLLRITNVGKGAAQNIEINFSVKELDNTERTSQIHVLLPNDFYEFYMPKNKNEELTFEFLCNNQVTIVGQWKCEDILCNLHEDSIGIDITSYVNRLKKTSTNVKYDYLEEIAEELKKIREKIDPSI